jgi:hypothetical protein
VFQPTSCRGGGGEGKQAGKQRVCLYRQVGGGQGAVLGGEDSSIPIHKSVKFNCQESSANRQIVPLLLLEVTFA